MRTDKYLWEQICLPIYRQMYKESTPSADFDKLIESGEASKQNWFMKYHLPQERAKEIFNEWCNKKKVSKHERRKISTTIWLGSAPSGVENEKE